MPKYSIDIPEDVLDIIGDIIIYEDQKQKSVYEIEEELDRIHEHLEINYEEEESEEDFVVNFTV